jgi:hypothetical protein
MKDKVFGGLYPCNVIAIFNFLHLSPLPSLLSSEAFYVVLYSRLRGSEHGRLLGGGVRGAAMGTAMGIGR